jgi:C-terminal processing protease CtpA/Prc
LNALSESLGLRVEPLHDLTELRPPLSPEQMRGIAEQARTLLSRFYVHAPTKRTLYAADPPALLTVLLDRLATVEPGTREVEREQEFHRDMTEIFTSVRDRHTVYVLPDPYRRAVAFLPFVVERCWEDGEPTYLITKVHPAIADDQLPDPRERPYPAVRVTHWNGVAMSRAVALSGQVNAGGNRDARLARGLTRLTFRWMGLGSRPLEDWVTLRYVVGDGEPQERKFSWLFTGRGPARPGRAAWERPPQRAGTRGIDGEGEWIRGVQRNLFAGKEAAPLEYTAATKEEPYGYLRIHSFEVGDAGLEAYLDLAAGLITGAPREGLILDIRGNPGGSIVAAERMLQMLSPKPVIPERLQFLSTPEAAAMARQYFAGLDAGADQPSAVAGFDRSRREAADAGAQYIVSPPVEVERPTGPRGCLHDGPKVLIVDALTYSAGDIFAAGFQDQGLGEVIGTDSRTGGGGGNVWEYDFVRQCAQSYLLDPLPRNASFDVAVRRATRVRANSGMAIEDVGVSVDSDPDTGELLVHRLTRGDVLHDNEALREFAVARLGRLVQHLPTAPAGA